MLDAQAWSPRGRGLHADRDDRSGAGGGDGGGHAAPSSLMTRTAPAGTSSDPATASPVTSSLPRVTTSMSSVPWLMTKRYERSSPTRRTTSTEADAAGSASTPAP